MRLGIVGVAFEGVKRGRQATAFLRSSSFRVGPSHSRLLLHLDNTIQFTTSKIFAMILFPSTEKWSMNSHQPPGSRHKPPQATSHKVWNAQGETSCFDSRTESRIPCGLWLVAGGLLLLLGCANYTTPVVTDDSRTPAERNFYLVWQCSLDVLDEFHFLVDQEDLREGRIATLPLTGQQWFEFWRGDAATPHDVAEGSLQTLYRTVRVYVEPVEGSQDRFAARVEVITSRAEQITRPLTNVVQAYSLFAIPGRTRDIETQFARQSVEDIPTARVTPLGRDTKLETKIAEAIARRTAASSQ